MAGDLTTRPSLLVRLRDTSDHEAWSQFVTVYTPLIFGFCRNRGLSETDAGDVTQEVLKAVAGAIPRFRYDPRRSSFRNWLFTVVRSKLNNFIAAQARQPRPAGDSTILQFAENEPDPAIEEGWQRDYQARLVSWAAHEIQGEFKEQTWNAFWRTAILGEAVDTVAGELGLTLNALYIARSRITSRLKQRIESIGDGAGLPEGIAHG
jgi:RNA polymerase sigma-70 factor (ECF subfamily)